MTTELDEIKQRKYEELQEAYRRQSEAEKQVEASIKKILTEKARVRLGNIKLVNHEMHLKAVQAIVYLHNAGQIPGQLNDAQLKEILKKFKEKKEINIKRK